MSASAEHDWLARLVGEWRSETEVTPGPEQPPVTQSGAEHVRALGGGWIVAEGRSDEPGGDTSLLTLGYDSDRSRVVGSYVTSTMSCLWIYEGALDAAGRVLTLDTEGPSLVAEGTTGRYRDSIELVDDDHRVMTSRYLGDDGAWHAFMTVRYTRVGR